jgi:transposase
MTQGERDRLVVLKKARKGLITQREAALELEVGERQVRRLLDRLKEAGDRAVIHGLKGQPANRKIGEAIRKGAVEALSDDKCHDFGPTRARAYLASKRKIAISKETARRFLRFTGTINLPCTSAWPLQTGHFYFALDRTNLRWFFRI